MSLTNAQGCWVSYIEVKEYEFWVFRINKKLSCLENLFIMVYFTLIDPSYDDAQIYFLLKEKSVISSENPFIADRYVEC